MFDKMFDCLNVSNFSEGKKARKPFKDPWRKGDLRLKVSVYFICNNVLYFILDSCCHSGLKKSFFHISATGKAVSVQGRSLV